MDINFYKSLGINLDLALEAKEVVQGETGQEIPGARVDSEKYDHAEVNIVNITNEHAAAIMGKPIGAYITIEAPVIRENNKEAHKQVTEILSKQLGKLFDLSMKSNVLVVGLGNWNATPDALGPKVIGSSLVTRHLFNYAPQELQEGMRPVSALSPGVLGITGIETAEIIKGVVDRVQPELVIAIDSLAASNINRVVTTIQIADTGVNPGSGVNNQRTGINKETLGCPVVAIGVPTVVNATFICKEAVESYAKKTGSMAQPGQDDPRIRQTLEEIVKPFGGNLTVTPKEVDSLIDSTAQIIAGGISMSLHPGINPDEYAYYMH
ncbi:MAG: GPR endopeptidase [Clostridiales bacterium]|nr:GPR endopeptidase [Clostridiales bacterium]MCF8022569.1 GPR endopeptidase [Clostridiales bacterium]